MQKSKVLVFDSGIGGLSIVKELLQYLPNIKLDYALDNAGFPYGDKPQNWLMDRILTYIGKVLEISQPDLLVIACNTASTLALANLRAKYKLPIVGVVPAIKPGVQMSKTGEIVVLATPNTMQSAYTHKLVEDFAINTKVNFVAHADLVNCTEDLMRGKQVDMGIIDAVVQDIAKYTQADSVILACTHYPFLKDILQQNLSKKYMWIDSGMAIVKRTASLLDLDLNSNLEVNTNKQNANNGKVYATKVIESEDLKQNLSKFGLQDFCVIDMQ